MEFLLEHEPKLREWAFYGPLVLMLCWEFLAPRRIRARPILTRWFSNVAVAVLNAIALRWFFPILALGLAIVAQQRGWGLFNQLSLPSPVTIVASVLLLDLLAYVRHRLFHAIPACWRFHRMHHSDQDVDWSTGLRFHPFEAIITAVVRMLLVVVLGTPPEAVLMLELLVAVTALFQHGNVELPEFADRWLRYVLVTPDMHRVHHSVTKRETDSNYGVVFSCWDRLLGTYREYPMHGQALMQVGLTELADPRHINVHWMLALPFLSTSQETLNERSE